MKQRLPAVVWLFAGAKIAFHVATTRLEHHRDELYFISASKRLAVSYVDFQPVTPALVWIERTIFGDSLIGLRLIPAVAGAAAIVLAALIARELGGDRTAQTYAALALLIVPAFVGMASALNTVSLETPAFMLVAFVFARLVRTKDERLYLALGAAAGFAVLVKFTMLAYLAGIALAIVASRLRADLSSPWLWAGCALGLAIMAPSVAWQFVNDLPVVEFVSDQEGGGAVLGLRGRAGYLVSLVILPGPLALPLTIAGARRLWTDERIRPLGIAIFAALLVLLVASGKGYYAFGGIAVICCAGAVAVGTWTVRARRVLTGLLIVNLLVPLALLVPLVPTSVLRNEDIAQATELSERFGWREFAQRIGEVASRLPDHERDRVIMLGRNYTLPAAIEFYADDYPVPRIAVSGHNSAYLWWPRLPRNHVGIAVGFERALLERLYEDVEHVGIVTNREGVRGYDWGDDISIVRGPKVSDDELRSALKVFRA